MGSFLAVSGSFCSLVRVRGGYHACDEERHACGERSSTGRVFVSGFACDLRGEAPARGELTLKTCLQPYPYSFRASSTLQSAVRSQFGPPPGTFGYGEHLQIRRQSINCGANYAFAEATDK